MIYTRKQNPTTSFGHSQTVTMQLLEDLFGCYRTVVADNFFTSIALAKRLLENGKVGFTDYRMAMVSS